MPVGEIAKRGEVGDAGCASNTFTGICLVSAYFTYDVDKKSIISGNCREAVNLDGRNLLLLLLPLLLLLLPASLPSLSRALGNSICCRRHFSLEIN